MINNLVEEAQRAAFPLLKETAVAGAANALLSLMASC
jgi:hypothetical protein